MDSDLTVGESWIPYILLWVIDLVLHQYRYSCLTLKKRYSCLCIFRFSSHDHFQIHFVTPIEHKWQKISQETWSVLLVTHDSYKLCYFESRKCALWAIGIVLCVHSPCLSGTALNICGILICHSNFVCKFIFCRNKGDTKLQQLSTDAYLQLCLCQKKSEAFQFYGNIPIWLY